MNKSRGSPTFLSRARGREMTDIVDRLQARKAFVKSGNDWLLTPTPDAECQEAAQEILDMRDTIENMKRNWDALGRQFVALTPSPSFREIKDGMVRWPSEKILGIVPPGWD